MENATESHPSYSDSIQWPAGRRIHRIPSQDERLELCPVVMNFKLVLYYHLIFIVLLLEHFDIECVQAVGDDEGTYCGCAARIAYTNSFCVVPVSKVEISYIGCET